MAVARLPTGTYALLAVATAGEHLATLVMEGADTEAVAAVSHASGFLSVSLLVERAVAEAQENAQTSLVEELVDSRSRMLPGLAARLGHYGVVIGNPMIVLHVDIDPAELSRASRMLRSTPGPTQQLVSLHDGHLCVVANTVASTVTDTDEPTVHRIDDALAGTGIDAVAGVSCSATGTVQDIRRAHGEAGDISAAARALGWTSGIVDFASLGAVGAVIRDRSGRTATEIVSRYLGPVIAYDRRRRTALVDTLWHYFADGELLAPTARALRVHPNTVRQRLERVDELLGPRWREPEGRFHTHLALRLHRVARNSGVDGSTS